MKKILMFATYTIAEPQHGGQKRVRAIYDTYNKLEGIEAKFSAIYYPPHYPASWPDDIAIPKEESSYLARHPLTGDVITGRLLRDNKRLKHKVKKLVQNYNPDIIELEHPFLYIGLEPILNELSYSGKIIYSSHNIEYTMKQEMLEGENVDHEQITNITKEIKEVELRLCSDSDLIFVVSEGDGSILGRLGVSRNKIILARNGIDKLTVEKNELNYWKNYFKEMQVEKIALFVGSAHPPNWTGFQHMVGSKVGFLQPNEKIVLAGSIGEYFRDSYKQDNVVSDVVFWKRIHATGRLSEAKLTALIDYADCILLPIIEGGGSNLKTAEAILSQKPVVGTSYAFRAFENFLDFPTIKFSDDPKKFRRLIRNCFDSPSVDLSADQQNSLREVTWEACLDKALREAITI